MRERGKDFSLFCLKRGKKRSGDDGEEEPPVPIPNTEVKLFSAEDTWWETAWENRSLPVYRKSCGSDYLNRSNMAPWSSG